MQITSKQAGFTFPELIIALSIVVTLLGLGTLNALNVQRSTSLNTAVDTLVSDIKQTQIKAMVSDADGKASPGNYGIYMDTANNKYTIFHGSSYVSDSTNITITFDNSITISSTFPTTGTPAQPTLAFLQRSGEISGFSATQNTITVRNSSGSQQKTIILNKYGVITSIN